MKLSCVVVAVLWCFAACSLSVNGGAKVSADGTKAVLNGSESILIQAPQPPLPVPPTPPPKPRRVLKAQVVGEKIEVLGKVVFDEDKATIKADSHPILNDVRLLLSEHSEIKTVRIEGHTDEGENDLRCKELSLQRATAVKEFLLKAGIDDSRLVVVGYGGERPRVSNDSALGREKNHRVEFSILAREEKPDVTPAGQTATTSAGDDKEDKTAEYKAKTSGKGQ